MSTARMTGSPRSRNALVDYLAFSLLFASVSVAIAVALGGIVLLLAPSGETAATVESSATISFPLAAASQAENQAGSR